MSDDQQPLPPGWVEATIDELCLINPKHSARIPDETHVSFVPMAAVSDVHGTIDSPEVRTFGEVKRGFTHFADGDVIFAKITPCMENGKAASVRGMTNGIACGTTEFFVFRSQGGVAQDYLYHFIRQESYRKAARAQMQSGVGQARVPKEFIENTLIPIPPLPEQRRIVSKIEALQERSGRAAKALAEVGPLLEQFRQSILAAAFSGRLTADWREKRRMGIPARHSSPKNQSNEDNEISGKNAQATENESAHELLTRIRTERRHRWEQAELAKFQAKGKQPPKDWKDKYEEPEPVDETDLPELPNGWCWTSLDVLTEFITSGSRGWAEFYADTGPLFVRAQNINTDKLVLDDVAHVRPPAGSEGIRTKIERGDLLIAITGANVTKAAPVEIDLGEAYVSQHVALARLLAPELLTYIHLWTVSASNGRAQLLEVAYGNGKPGLNLEHLRRLRIAFPPTDEQNTIVASITAAISSMSLIRLSAFDARSDLTQLNQSILAKAFRGELVPQDPNDEPASELLARIRNTRKATVQKQTQKSPKKAGKK